MTDLCKAVKAHLDEISHLISGADYVIHRLVQEWMADIMELLKPVRFKITGRVRSYPFWDAECPGCGYKTSTVHENWKYCPECGRAVKWE